MSKKYYGVGKKIQKAMLITDTITPNFLYHVLEIKNGFIRLAWDGRRRGIGNKAHISRGSSYMDLPNAITVPLTDVKLMKVRSDIHWHLVVQNKGE